MWIVSATISVMNKKNERFRCIFLKYDSGYIPQNGHTIKQLESIP